MFARNFFKGGTKVPHFKNTAECETVKMGVPEKVVIPMLQHVGAPCEPCVKKGDTVRVGQVIGNSDKYISSPIHSSVSGTVNDVAPMLFAGGIYVTAVEIKTDGKQEIYEGIKPPSFSNSKEFISAIRESGLVGLGGAGFPAHVKLSPPPDKKIDTLIINAAECEPYITSDYREIIENSWNVVSGINIIMEILGIENVLIGIEDNKPEAIKEMTRVAATDDRINVIKLKSRYPQGAEKMLIYATTGRKVPPGKLPADVGVIVMNVNSVSFISEYIKTGMPLIKKRVTVDGPSVKRPGNVEVLIGTPISEVFSFCGGFGIVPKKILMGGPMMGIAQYTLDTPVLKHTNALLAFDETTAVLPKEQACIRCGRCVRACPMNLLPLYLNNNSIRGNIEELNRYHVMDCIECGSCAYVCPAKINLVQSIRLGKAQVRQAAAKGGN
ncbi:MAG TPA: electron transport complex subunit RsxC [Hungateiclostridium thermocellum]|jgi:electron transport complex protein RnfC|uniref:Ion-translocating oxidoreductase complex subunit C n=2 Tax=Acetivibrio thermocellus TaxID=1515 RepID=A3DI53_ACET2|nr:electron transport complex subunit RsxC [Acetivibrio thermocellus]CDG36953.1 RnfABCDGE type electron transport complex subunit C [Acetivibrio thermocellus BC1]ABN53632.1 electron transport complex, RnfABCDGE type, C subunit [Acetivibrio thermocellus ATCC 27405]ADU73160.1 electron transport complex, RnfABCDGE type, C subunit [Acetivibrio thermocellus DSM 1313]ALX07073.1 Electron transport complex protein rnfC [Acetivibrio thermocellus AD2]ANV74809.1 Electron transport complex protein rnfC [A